MNLYLIGGGVIAVGIFVDATSKSRSYFGHFGDIEFGVAIIFLGVLFIGFAALRTVLWLYSKPSGDARKEDEITVKCAHHVDTLKEAFRDPLHPIVFSIDKNIEEPTCGTPPLESLMHAYPHTQSQDAISHTLNTGSSAQEYLKVKTQAEQDAELLASDEWRQIQAEAVTIWKTRINELQETIASLQGERNFLSLAICSNFFGAVLPGGESIFLPSFRDVVIAKIEQILSIEKYRAHMLERTVKAYNSYPRTVAYYVSEFVVQRNNFLVGALSVFNHFPANSEIIVRDIDALNTMLCELNPEAGGVGRSKWIGHTRTYAKENLIGMSPLYFYPEYVPRYIRNHFASDLEQSGSLFVMQALGLLNAVGKRLLPSTSRIGIEFENRLRDTILAEIPDSVIETTPVTGDHGADLLIRVGSIRIVIQAKRYTGVVGNAAVQEVFAAKQFYDADYAMVVTTSRFTNPAKVLADKLDVLLATDNNFILLIRRLLV